MEEKDLRYYAKVHSVESFGTVDGPGIRFVLFLQGCHLQCKYCHNRDTWDMKGGSYKSLDEIFNKIMNYKNYICPNGGVTITGGEPLLQAKFVFELFTKLKKQNIHTCIDTSGMVALTEDIKKVLSYLKQKQDFFEIHHYEIENIIYLKEETFVKDKVDDILNSNDIKDIVENAIKIKGYSQR